MYESVGIRAQGLGGAFTAVADDATATWWNPAGVAAGPYFDAVAEYSKPDATNNSRQAFALAFPALGLSYYRLPLSEMQTFLPTGSAVSGRQDQGYLSQFGATVGQSIGHVVLASTVKVLNANSETHADLDLGALVTLGHLRAGVSLRNLHETSFAANPVAFELKRQARVGVSWTATPGKVVLTAAGDADLTSVATLIGDQQHIAGGLEAWLFKKIIGVRGGLARDTKRSLDSHSGGLSVMALSGQYLKTYLDAQWTGGSDVLRRGWGAELRVTF